MNTAWIHVSTFVPIPPVWLFRGPMLPGFGAGSNQSSPTDQKNTGGPRWPERQQCEARALPNHLLWTWFVDNPRRNCSEHKEEQIEH
jgi:hypothetical protein